VGGAASTCETQTLTIIKAAAAQVVQNRFIPLSQSGSRSRREPTTLCRIAAISRRL